jgi:hypothetical protein
VMGTRRLRVLIGLLVMMTGRCGFGAGSEALSGVE